MLDSSLAAELSPVQPQRSLLARLRDAARMVLFLRVPEGRLSPTSLEIVGAVILTLLAPTVYNLVTIGSDGRLANWELPRALFHIPIMLIAIGVVARVVRREEAITTLLFAICLAWFAIDVVAMGTWLAMKSLGHGGGRYASLAFYFVPLAWLILAATRFTSGLTTGWMHRLGALLAYALLLAVPLLYIHPERSLWVKDWSKDTEAMARPRSAAGSEEALYKQPELLTRELAAVEPGRKGVIDVFFVGVAGYGSQDVFMREVDSVAKLMRERFGADGHIVKLENNPNSVLTNPIASVTSLRAALKRVSEAMDPEEDVLVLFLTSHGSADFKFSLELWPFEFKTLDPPALRAALDESGIKNRVVIISACYAGGFVEALRDDRTLVITAAARDRNSFGCDNMAQWTYFGRAYFDEALRETYSFTKAFEIAKPLIERREKEQKYDPSLPQIAAGPLIEAKLAALAAQLEKPAATAEPAPSAPARKGDLFDRYVDLIFAAPMEEVRRACLENMRTSSPETWLEKDPQVFGGLNKSSPQWGRLVAAWDKYAETYCTKANDPALLRATYEEAVRAKLTEREIAPVMQFLSSDVGKAWFARDREVDLAQAKQLAKITNEMATVAYRSFSEEQARIVADFRKP